MQCTCTAGDALDNQRRHRHGDGRCDVLEQLGVRLEWRYSNDEQRAGTGADAGMPLKLRIFAADVRCLDRYACPRATPPTRDPEAVRRIFSGVCHNVFRSCGPSAATQGVEAQMPLDYGARSVGQPCLRAR